MKADKVEI